MKNLTKNIRTLALIAALVALCCFNYSAIYGQPTIEWQKSLGGSNADYAYSVQQTNDGGYIVAGFSWSTNGDVTGNQGNLDYWVVKLDTSGNISWQKSLGGSSSDSAYSIQQTNDGGYIVAGRSLSTDGDVTGNHGSFDYWVVKLDTSGNISWQKSLGGSGGDIAYSIQQTTDGGYITAGSSYSTDGDVTGSHGSYDYWVVKLDTLGNISWQKSLGGSSGDEAKSIQQTTDGGYIVAGYSQSTDGDVTGNHGSVDYWIVKLDTSGNILWQKSLGGSDADAASLIQKTTDGGYIVAGYSQSSDGDVTGNHISWDYWVVKLDASGNISWQKSLGGCYYDFATSIQQTTDGGYIVAGTSESTDCDVSGNHGSYDYWLVKLDASGNIIWQKSLGGSSFDEARSIQQTTDGGYIVVGYSSSTNGDVTGNHGSYDYWVVKLSPVTNVNFLTGNVFNDANNNGIKDNNEQGIKGMLVKTNNNTYCYSTDTAGNYVAYSLIASDTLKLINNFYATVTPSYYLVTTSETGKNFAVHIIPGVTDVRVTVTNLTPARPGFDDVLQITYENVGTDTVSSNLTLDFPSPLTFVNSSPAQSGINGNTISWNYSNLVPAEKRNIIVTLNVPPSVVIGTVLNFNSVIFPVVGDTAPNNNYNSIEQLVTGSYDPNEKQVIPNDGLTPQDLANGDKLVYTIHFQNTGTDTAFNIKIVDTLSAKVDAGTFEILSSSHTCTFNMKAAGIIEFNFPNILLPDSNVNFIGSNGFVKYAVKPLSTLALGDSITNTAYIYFDFNSPIQTNIVSSLIHPPFGIFETGEENGGIFIYPNPASSVISCELGRSQETSPSYSKCGRCKVYNSLGMLITEKTFTGNKFQIDVSKLSKGLYLVKVENEEKVAVRRFLKE